MTNPTPLSPAAQAVLDALHTEGSTGPERFWARANAAAALRAAADECQGLPDGLDCTELLLSIAAELDGTNPSESD